MNSSACRWARRLQFLVGLAGHRSEQAPGELFAQHCQRLEEGFHVGREAIDAGGQETLDGRRELQGRQGARRHGRRQVHTAGRMAVQHPWSTRVCTISSMKKGLPAVFATIKCCTGCMAASLPSNAVSKACASSGPNGSSRSCV